MIPTDPWQSAMRAAKVSGCWWSHTAPVASWPAGPGSDAAVGSGSPSAFEAMRDAPMASVGSHWRPSAHSCRCDECEWQAPKQRLRHAVKHPGSRACVVGSLDEQRDAHMCTQPVLQSSGLGTVDVAQSRPP